MERPNRRNDPMPNQTSSNHSNRNSFYQACYCDSIYPKRYHSCRGYSGPFDQIDLVKKKKEKCLCLYYQPIRWDDSWKVMAH